MRGIRIDCLNRDYVTCWRFTSIFIFSDFRFCHTRCRHPWRTLKHTYRLLAWRYIFWYVALDCSMQTTVAMAFLRIMPTWSVAGWRSNILESDESGLGVRTNMGAYLIEVLWSRDRHGRCTLPLLPTSSRRCIFYAYAACHARRQCDSKRNFEMLTNKINSGENWITWRRWITWQWRKNEVHMIFIGWARSVLRSISLWRRQ